MRVKSHNQCLRNTDKQSPVEIVEGGALRSFLWAGIPGVGAGFLGAERVTRFRISVESD